MAIALGTFRALVNFAEKEQILGNFSRYPYFCLNIQEELSNLVSSVEFAEEEYDLCLRALLAKLGELD